MNGDGVWVQWGYPIGGVCGRYWPWVVIPVRMGCRKILRHHFYTHRLTRSIAMRGDSVIQHRVSFRCGCIGDSGTSKWIVRWIRMWRIILRNFVFRWGRMGNNPAIGVKRCTPITLWWCHSMRGRPSRVEADFWSAQRRGSATWALWVARCTSGSFSDFRDEMWHRHLGGIMHVIRMKRVAALEQGFGQEGSRGTVILLDGMGNIIIPRVYPACSISRGWYNSRMASRSSSFAASVVPLRNGTGVQSIFTVSHVSKLDTCTIHSIPYDTCLNVTRVQYLLQYHTCQSGQGYNHFLYCLTLIDIYTCDMKFSKHGSCLYGLV